MIDPRTDKGQSAERDLRALPHDWHVAGVRLPHPDGSSTVFVAPTTIEALLDDRFDLPTGGPNRFLAARPAAALIHAGWVSETRGQHYAPTAALVSMMETRGETA